MQLRWPFWGSSQKASSAPAVPKRGPIKLQLPIQAKPQPELYQPFLAPILSMYDLTAFDGNLPLGLEFRTLNDDTEICAALGLFDYSNGDFTRYWDMTTSFDSSKSPIQIARQEYAAVESTLSELIQLPEGVSRLDNNLFLIANNSLILSPYKPIYMIPGTKQSSFNKTQ